MQATAAPAPAGGAPVTPAGTATMGPAPDAAAGDIVTVIAEPLLLRVGPSRESGALGAAKVGEQFTVISREGDWLQVCCLSGRPVWLAGAFVQITKSTPTAP